MQTSLCHCSRAHKSPCSFMDHLLSPLIGLDPFLLVLIPSGQLLLGLVSFKKNKNEAYLLQKNCFK